MRRNLPQLLILGASTIAVCLGAVPGSTAARTAAKGWDEPVLISKSQAARETSLVVNPRDEREMLVCEPSGVPATTTGQSYFFRTVDGGKKWTYLEVETAQNDTRNYAFEGGDCDVAYDQGGTMWTADTWLGNLSIGHSKDGESWEGTALATSAPVVDRPWLVGGPPGTLYVTYHDLQCCTPSLMWFTKTTDYGKTFSPAVPITTATPAGAYTWEGNFVVANRGRDLYLVYSRRIGGIVDAGRPEIIALAESHDGGATWTSSTIATLPRETTSIYPAIALDAGGYLHVVWAAPRTDDDPVFYTMSKDRGKTWSKPRALNAGKSGYGPWVAGGRKGQARIAWLGSPEPKNAKRWFFYYAKVDNGRTVATGPTTKRPIWEGTQTMPEFEMVRLDKKGRMHLGMSVFVKGPRGNSVWAAYYQRESR